MDAKIGFSCSSNGCILIVKQGREALFHESQPTLAVLSNGIIGLDEIDVIDDALSLVKALQLDRMELTLQNADVLWLTQPLEKQTGVVHGPLASQLTVVQPSANDHDVGESLPCRISISAEELMTEKKTSLLDQHVTFNLLDGVEIVATHVLKLRDCIPVLTEGSVHWTQPVWHKDVRAVDRSHGLFEA